MAESSNTDLSMSGRSAEAVARGAADWLCLAATPTFAVMALLAGVLGGHMDMPCMTMHEASLLRSVAGGMVPMYVLMSAFHVAPWLRLIAGRRRGEGP